MNVFITLSIAAINIIAVVMIYQFIKQLPKKERLIFIAVSVAIHYMLISFVYWLSGWGMEQNIQSDMLILAFVPVNVILSIPFLANAYTKMKNKTIKQNNFRNRIIIVGVIIVLVLIFEYSYFKNYQNDLIEKQKNKSENGVNIIIDNNIETNSVQNTLNNKITNSMQNTISNKTTNSVEQNVIR